MNVFLINVNVLPNVMLSCYKSKVFLFLDLWTIVIKPNREYLAKT